MKPTPEKPFSLVDFQPALLQLRDAELQQVLVGGLAVSAWAEMFLEGEERLEFDLPIYSKDIDLRGAKISAIFLARELRSAGADVDRLGASLRDHLNRSI